MSFDHSSQEVDKPGVTTNTDHKTTVSDADIKPTIALHLIRHAESGNNEVYRNARYIYR